MQIVKSVLTYSFRMVLLGCLSLLVACTSEPEFNDYSISIRNTSGHNLEISTYFEGDFSETVRLRSEESGLTCSYKSEVFLAYRSGECQIDSMKIVFSNEKGYLASLYGSTGYDFLETTSNGMEISGPFERHSMNIMETNSSQKEFEITTYDYENAHKLPE